MRPSRLSRARFLLLLWLAGLLACKSEPQPIAPPPAASSVAPLAQSAAPSASAAAIASSTPALDPAAQSRPFLWRVTKGEHVSHLFGTLHMGADAERQLHPIVWRVFEQAPAFVMEADPTAINPFDVARLAMLPAGDSLQKKLSPAAWKALTDKIGTSMMMVSVEQFKPWFAMVTLTQAMIPPQGQPMDAVFQQKASATGKTLAYLELVDEQLGMLDAAVTAQVLDDMLKNLAKAEETLHGSMKAYLAGDAEGLAKLLFDPEEMKKHKKMFDLTFTQRNKRWIPLLEKHFAAGPTFVAVGAGHMFGDDGLVALLAKKGYTVERVSIEPGAK